MKRILAMVLVFCLMGAAALADTVITVPGTSTVYVPADRAVITLGVSARETEVQAAQSRVNTVIAAIRASLLENGCAESDITTGSISVYANYDWISDQETLSGYTASSTLSVRTADITRAGTLIDLAFAAGANILSGIEFYASDTSAASEQALRGAVADAASQADVIADAAGLTLTGIREISKSSSCNYSTGDTVALYKNADSLEAASAPTVVNAAQIAVTMSVMMVFTAETK